MGKWTVVAVLLWGVTRVASAQEPESAAQQPAVDQPSGVGGDVSAAEAAPAADTDAPPLEPALDADSEPAPDGSDTLAPVDAPPPSAAESALGEPQAGGEPPPPEYAPALDFMSGGTKISIPFSAALRVEALNAFPVAADGTEYDPGAILDGRMRLGLRWSSERELVPARLVVTLEADTPTGRLAGGAESIGPYTPHDDGDDGFENENDDLEIEVRKAYLQLDIGYHIHIVGGVMTSHWGMGLLANDGALGWTPGSSLFADPRGGDRLLRNALIVGPFGDQKLAFVVGGDWVLDEPWFTDDDSTIEKDEAKQVVGSIVWGFREPNNLGIYAVHRWQRAPDHDEANIKAIDMAGAREIPLGERSWLRLEAEAAYLWGHTQLGPSLDFPTHDVKQFGAAGRATLDLGVFGTAVDVLYASGDENFDDGELNGFRADVNYPLGLLAHRHVLAAQSARSVITASDLTLVGVPAEDLERVPTRQQITNTLAVFPRVMVRPIEALEIFAGPLLLFAPEDVLDPFNTRIAGGDGRNAFDGKPGDYIGTELDLGIRYRRMLATTEFIMGLEGGVFLPGDAFQDPAGDKPDPVSGGRFTTEYRF